MTDQNKQQLVLVSARKSRGREWSRDDYDVRLGDANGRVVGRIFKAVTAPAGRNWFWTITERGPSLPTDRGCVGTREEAMAAFRGAYFGEAQKDG